MTFFPERQFRPDACIQCGKCSRVCPSSAVVSVDGTPGFVPAMCIHCGHCGMFCPVNAYGLSERPGDGTPADPTGFKALLHRRYSVRKYSDKVPSEEEMKELLSVVSTSPTGRNAQGLILRTVRGREEMDDLLEPVLKRIRILAKAGIPQMAGRIFGMSDYVERIRKGEDLIFRKAPAAVFFHVPRSNVTARSDGVIAASTVMLHAVSMGMGTLWNGIAEKIYPFIGPWHDRRIGRTLLAAVLCIGYSAEEPVYKAPERDYDLLSFFSPKGS